MAYDRDKAIQYAEKHWNIPCDDGIFWLSNERISIAAKRKQLKAPEADGWMPMFVKGSGTDPEKAVFRRTVGGVIEEKVINDWAGLADCAHFLSRCLTAGGAKVDERGVRALVETLQNRSDTKTLCEKVDRARAQNVIDTGVFKHGDMLGYFNISPQGDYGGRLSYTHSTMFAGKKDKAGIGGVTCHTVARFPPKSWVEDSWFLHTGYTYTLIHFSSDDPPLDPLKAEALAGWWKVDFLGKTEYYKVTEKGTAKNSNRQPKKASEGIYPVESSAYWYMDKAGKVTFIWRATGHVVVWTPKVGGGGYTGIMDGVATMTVTRLF